MENSGNEVANFKICVENYSEICVTLEKATAATYVKTCKSITFQLKLHQVKKIAGLYQRLKSDFKTKVNWNKYQCQHKTDI